MELINSETLKLIEKYINNKINTIILESRYGREEKIVKVYGKCKNYLYERGEKRCENQ